MRIVFLISMINHKYFMVKKNFSQDRFASFLEMLYVNAHNYHHFLLSIHFKFLNYELEQFDT